LGALVTYILLLVCGIVAEMINHVADHHSF